MEQAPRATRSSLDSEYAEQVLCYLGFTGGTNQSTEEKIIRHMVSKSFAGKDEELTEAEIGKPFIRNFDPSENSNVRTAKSNFKLRLEVYYQDKGAHDPLELRFLRRSYKLECVPRSTGLPPEVNSTPRWAG